MQTLWMQTPLEVTSSGSHCSGRYTSYWNAFLFSSIFCSPDVLDENEVHMGSLDLAFSRTKKQGNKAKLWGFRPLAVKVTTKYYISINNGIFH